MRITFFTHYFPPEGNAPASRTYQHCLRWAKAGHDITVITCAPNVPDGVVYDGYRNRLWPQTEMVDGIKVVRVWTYLAANAGGLKRIFNFVSYMISALFAFVFFVRRPKVIIATSPQFFCGWAGVFASWLKWRPLILEIRDIWPESIVTVGAMKKGMIIRMLEWAEKIMYRAATHIVAVGNGYRDNIKTKANVENRISVITNGVDLEDFKPQPKSAEFLEEYGIKDKFVCSYAGTIGMAHGLDVTIRAAKILQQRERNDIVFFLVGDGARRQQLQELATENGVQDMVIFAGRLPKSEMPTVLASSDCLLIHLKKTDLFETVIPSKIFEAMAMQRPLIMGVRGESADIVASSKSGIPMEPDNENDLVDAVCRLADEPEFQSELCTNGRRFASENYSRDHLAAEFLKLIERIAQ